jgi:hypothetical protein
LIFHGRASIAEAAKNMSISPGHWNQVAFQVAAGLATP